MGPLPSHGSARPFSCDKAVRSRNRPKLSCKRDKERKLSFFFNFRYFKIKLQNFMLPVRLHFYVFLPMQFRCVWTLTTASYSTNRADKELGPCKKKMLSFTVMQILLSPWEVLADAFFIRCRIQVLSSVTIVGKNIELLLKVCSSPEAQPQHQFQSTFICILFCCPQTWDEVFDKISEIQVVSFILPFLLCSFESSKRSNHLIIVSFPLSQFHFVDQIW